MLSVSVCGPFCVITPPSGSPFPDCPGRAELHRVESRLPTAAARSSDIRPDLGIFRPKRLVLEWTGQITLGLGPS